MAKLALGGNKKCGPGEICDRTDKKVENGYKESF